MWTANTYQSITYVTAVVIDPSLYARRRHALNSRFDISLYRVRK